MTLPPDFAMLPRRSPYATIDADHASSIGRDERTARPNGESPRRAAERRWNGPGTRPRPSHGAPAR